MTLLLFSDIQECASDPCQNGAACDESTLNMFKCICPNGFTGIKCETGKLHILARLHAFDQNKSCVK